MSRMLALIGAYSRDWRGMLIYLRFVPIETFEDNQPCDATAVVTAMETHIVLAGAKNTNNAFWSVLG